MDSLVEDQRVVSVSSGFPSILRAGFTVFD